MGLVFGVLGFLVYALAPVSWMVLVGVPIMALWGLTGPSVQSLMSRRVLPTQQGQLQGAQGSLRGIAAMFGPFLFTSAFRWGIDESRAVPLPGAHFLVAAALLVMALYVARVVTREAAPSHTG